VAKRTKPIDRAAKRHAVKRGGRPPRARTPKRTIAEPAPKRVKAPRQVRDRSPREREAADAVVADLDTLAHAGEDKGELEYVLLPSGGVARLRVREAEYIQRFLVSLNSADAVRGMGYSGEAMWRFWHAMQRSQRVQAVIKEKLDARAKRYDVSADKIMSELARLGFSNVQDYMRITDGGDPAIDLSAVDRDQFAAVSELNVEDFIVGRGDGARDVRRVRIKMHDKLSALKTLGNAFALFPERHEVTGAGGGPVDVEAKSKLIDQILAAVTPAAAPK
jgi:phage terminase small subunit